MVSQVCKEFNISESVWHKILLNSTAHAVTTVKPSSTYLNDSIDFHEFIKIVTVVYPNQDKCRYVNGIVFKKEVANRRMRTKI